jgi:hypothetical protein
VLVSRPSPPKRRSAVICKEEIEAVIDADTERLNVSPALTLVVQGQLCASVEWSRSTAAKPHVSPSGQWHGACGHAPTMEFPGSRPWYAGVTTQPWGAYGQGTRMESTCALWCDTGCGSSLSRHDEQTACPTPLPPTAIMWFGNLCRKIKTHVVRT